jgi:hypothetical protein
MVASADAPLNSTPLLAHTLDAPISNMSVGITHPDLGEVIPSADAAHYDVRLAIDVPEADPLVAGVPEIEAFFVEVALDGERPRRLTRARPSVALGELLRADAVLSEGEHWLFAAPVPARGVPRRAPGVPRSAVARRFFLGRVPEDRSGPSGAVWLRSPTGTYNGPNSGLLFDAFAFSATGAALEAPCTIALSGPGAAGELRLLAPFLTSELASGDYEVKVSAPAASPVSVRFTVNGELSGRP